MKVSKSSNRKYNSTRLLKLLPRQGVDISTTAALRLSAMESTCSAMVSMYVRRAATLLHQVREPVQAYIGSTLTKELQMLQPPLWTGSVGRIEGFKFSQVSDPKSWSVSTLMPMPQSSEPELSSELIPLQQKAKAGTS